MPIKGTLKIDGIPRTLDRTGWLEQLQEECERMGHSGVTPCRENPVAELFGDEPVARIYTSPCRICLVLAELHKLWEAGMSATEPNHAD